MKRRTLVAGIAVAIGLGAGATSAQMAPPGPVAIPPERLAAAKQVAGLDLSAEIDAVCTGAWQAQGHRDGSKIPTTNNSMTAAEPRRIFDNFYWVGFKQIGAWALKTSDGIVLFDTLTSEDATKNVLVPQMIKLGLDPSQIKYIIISHGHFDHIGGAAYLKRTYGARIAMGAPDWKYITESRPFDPPQQAQFERPALDIALKDQDAITVGDAKIVTFLTPGHTPGSIAAVIPVKKDGKTLKLVLVGGGLPMQTGLNLGWFRENLKRAAGPEGVADIINSHPFGSDPNIRAALATGEPATPWGTEKVDRYLRGAAECTADQLSG